MSRPKVLLWDLREDYISLIGMEGIHRIFISDGRPLGGEPTESEQELLMERTLIVACGCMVTVIHIETIHLLYRINGITLITRWLEQLRSLETSLLPWCSSKLPNRISSHG